MKPKSLGRLASEAFAALGAAASERKVVQFDDISTSLESRRVCLDFLIGDAFGEGGGDRDTRSTVCLSNDSRSAVCAPFALRLVT